jgi:hypothetical protein
VIPAAASLAGKVTLGKLLTGLIAANVAALLGDIVVSTHGIDWAAWAGPVNTLLLIVLAIVARSNNQKIDSTHDSVHETASSAASAAEAAAEACRVAKAIGATLRTEEAPTVIPPTALPPGGPSAG